MRIRALVLAAGHGSRLRPLTHFVPKPLLPVAGKSPLLRTLERLSAVGCEAVAINLCHLGERIEAALGSEHRGMPLVYSPEGERQGTLGALAPLRSFLSKADVILLINGDSVCDWPLRRMIRRHRRSGAAATLLLHRRADPLAFGGGVAVDKKGRILSLRPGVVTAGPIADRQVFAGAQVLSPALLDRVPDGPANLVPHLYEPLLAEGRLLLGVSTGRRWNDLGTPERYLEAALDWSRGRGPVRLFRRRWVAAGVVVRPGAHLGRSAIEAGAEIGTGVRLDRVLVLPDARVGAGCSLRRTVVGFGVHLPPRTAVEGRMITPQRKDQPAEPGDSVVAEVVYTPLDHGRPSQRDGDLA